ncbi:MAG: hypothetical protein IKO23_06060 [Bacteroidales bacterium]|nr:hypothetical protein [Bacteroidales bacterium]
MKNIKSIKELRNDLSCVEKKPGCYIWWFDKNGKDMLLKSLPDFNISSIPRKGNYYALYYGIAKDCRQRINWHINQKHSFSAVKSGYLSTLRQTLSALLGKDMTCSEKDVNDFMDTHCCWSWEYTPSRETAEDIESVELSTQSKNCYPLNIQKNKTVSHDVIQKLTELRKKHKK